MNRVHNVLLLILFVSIFMPSCASNEAEMLYKEAVKIEHQDGIQKALPYYKEIIQRYPESESATKSREKVVSSFKLTKSQAHRLVTNDCSYIRSRASFTISTKCDFSILELKTVGDGYNKISKITIYSKGFWYDITFTVIYGITYDNDGDFISNLLEVRKGRFTGLGDLAQEFLRKDSNDPIKKMTDAISKSDRKNERANSSSYSSNRGSVWFSVHGEWFYGSIKSLKIRIEGRNTFPPPYTKSSSDEHVYFYDIPYDTYDFTIYAYEQSGQRGQAHSLKGNFSHRCKSTNVSIWADSILNPYVKVNCD